MNGIDFGRFCVRVIAGMGLALVALGCEKGESTKDSTAAKATASNAADASDPQVTAMLAKADAKDGKVDQTVSKCALCSFRMDGTPDHKVAYAGYNLHFCAPHCKESFEKDPKQQTLAMKVEP